MSRTVATPGDATYVAYVALPDWGDDVDSAQENFEDDIANLQGEFRYRFKSFQECSRWVGREFHVILDGPRGAIGVSEYCGLLAIWYVANGPALSEEKFRRVCGNVYGHDNLLRLVATFSNGEAMYSPAGTL